LVVEFPFATTVPMLVQSRLLMLFSTSKKSALYSEMVSHNSSFLSFLFTAVKLPNFSGRA
jgi:hypothetical protein